ncbi:MepB family protein [Flavobacterium pectinovorum]|uniref:MepB family protein n=1 Tax=Flavobacterium pectinovorum TaxID=29533 RepID=UPI001FADFEC5|nr:MepB family protein [Flavobacterium pectinovorum]MCI9844099.1 MepB family protein [Flavobacterium pectinovorum]
MTTQGTWNNLERIPHDLILVKELVYDFCSFACTQPQPEAESAEYNAYRFEINKKTICYREAKITPTKTGQFVTLWKRNISGTIEPFDFSDLIDFVVISVRKENSFGQFIFPKAVLLEKGIFSTQTKEGKRATRVYPPWDITTSKQAQKTQNWQLDYFLDLSNKKAAVSKAKLLFDIQ